MAGSIKDAFDSRTELQSQRAGRYGAVLDDEAKKARDSSQALDEGEGAARSTAEILVALDHLKEMMVAQKKREERLMRELDKIAKQMREALGEAEKVHGEVMNDKAMVRDAVESGLLEAHSIATEHALKEIAEVAEGAKKQIKTLENESRERTERLRKLTRTNRLLNSLKWLFLFVGGCLAGLGIATLV